MLDLAMLDLNLVNLDLRSENSWMSPFEANIDQTSQIQDSMVTIDWIASDSSLEHYLHGRLQHTALNLSS